MTKRSTAEEEERVERIRRLYAGELVEDPEPETGETEDDDARA